MYKISSKLEFFSSRDFLVRVIIIGQKELEHELEENSNFKNEIKFSHQIDGNDEIVLLPLPLLLVFAGLYGAFGCHFHLAFLSCRLLGRLRRALSAWCDLLTSCRRLLTGSTFLIYMTHAIRRFVACLQSKRQDLY